MSKSTDPDNFFQTNHSVAETRRRALKSTNNHGNPIRLQSKILAVIPDLTHNGIIYVAESTGTARRIVLENDQVSPPYRGPIAPATCLALSPPTPQPQLLFAGSWDKAIYSWQALSRAPQHVYRNGHTDFVKAVLTTRLPSPTGTDVLISSGADARIIIWAISSGEKLHVLRASTSTSGGVLALALLPPPSYLDAADDEDNDNDTSSITVFTANTLPFIRRFALSSHPPALSEISPDSPLTVHETSVYALHFDADGDLWTASADGDVTCLARDKNWDVEMRIRTGGWARGVAVDEQGGWVVSGGRDEELRIWDRGTGRLHHVYSGHYDEITGLLVLGALAVTVSLDGTVRRWSLRGDDLQEARRKKREEEESGVVLEDEGGDGMLGEELGVTEEEERELAELME